MSAPTNTNGSNHWSLTGYHFSTTVPFLIAWTYTTHHLSWSFACVLKVYSIAQDTPLITLLVGELMVTFPPAELISNGSFSVPVRSKRPPILSPWTLLHQASLVVPI
ncbi:MAG: hypothetical protein WCL02_05250 [bacterium]